MELTPRMRQIFQILLQEPAAVSVNYLAQKIGVSRRTVQRELESIGASLKAYELTFVSKTGAVQGMILMSVTVRNAENV